MNHHKSSFLEVIECCGVRSEAEATSDGAQGCPVCPMAAGVARFGAGSICRLDRRPSSPTSLQPENNKEVL